MALKATIGKINFGVGDVIKVYQKIKDGEKTRSQIFEGTVISIKGRGDNRSFTLRKVGAQNIGIERIFSIITPNIQRVEIIRKGIRGVRRAKLYYIRKKHRREIESIYTREKSKNKRKKSKLKIK